MCSIQDYKEGSGYLSFEHVSKIFMEGPEPVAALKNINLDIGCGEFISIMGASGSGKTKVTFSAPSGSKVKVWETEKEITFGSNGSVSADIIAVGEITL